MALGLHSADRVRSVLAPRPVDVPGEHWKRLAVCTSFPVWCLAGPAAGRFGSRREHPEAGVEIKLQGQR